MALSDNDFDPSLNFHSNIDCRYCESIGFAGQLHDNSLLVINQNVRSFNRNGDELLLFL